MPGVIELVSCQVDKGDVVTGAQIVELLLFFGNIFLRTNQLFLQKFRRDKHLKYKTITTY